MRKHCKSLRGSFIGLLAVQLVLSLTPYVPALAVPGNPVQRTNPAPTTAISSSGAGVTSVPGQSLSIDGGSTHVIDMSNLTGSTMNLHGDLTNAGTIYVVSTNPSITNVAISAANIFNLQGALLTTILPSSGLPGFTSLVANLNLSLFAVHNIVNGGTISSAGSLNMTAGNSIINQLPSGATGMSPSIMAMQNLTMQAGNIVNSGTMLSQLSSLNAYTANLMNSGAMQALTGQVNIQNLIGNSLSVDNAGGLISGKNGINFSTLGTVYDANNTLVSKAMLEVLGGSLKSPTLSAVSPDGQINIAVNEITGGVNLSGGTAVVSTTGSSLTIASMALTGDPIFAANGTLNLSGLFSPAHPQFATYGGDFIALATGDIIATGVPLGANINAQAQVGDGGQIYLNAGTNFTVANSHCFNCVLGVDYTIGTPSTTGGSIDMPGVDLVTNCNTITLLAHTGVYGNPEGPALAFQEHPSNPGSINIGNILLCCPTDASHQEMASQNVNITAPGNITVRSITNTDGSINVQSLFGNVSVLPDNLLQAFNGSLSLTANQNLTTGSNVTMDAVGGNLNLTATEGTLTTGANNNLSAYKVGYSGGHVNLSSGGNMYIGEHNNVYGDSGIDATSHCGSITTGQCSTFVTCCKDIDFTALNGCIFIGDKNTMSANGGDINMTAGGDIVTGCDDIFNAFRKDNHGGDVKFTAIHGDTRFADSNQLNAVGGDICITAGHNVIVDDKSQFNAFDKYGSGGNVTITAKHGSISFDDCNWVNAVGGDLSMTAFNKFTSGTSNQFNAFASTNPWSSGGGQLSLVTGGDIRIGDYNQFVGSNIGIISFHGDISTGKHDTFQACCGNVSMPTGSGFAAAQTETPVQTCCGNIEIVALKGDICLGDYNSMEASGGDIVLTSAVYGHGSITTGKGDSFSAWQVNGKGGNIDLNAPGGDINVGRSNNFNAVGGNVTFDARYDINVGDSSQINAFRQCDSGGSVKLTSQYGNIKLDDLIDINAVGGNLKLTAYGGKVSTGYGNNLNAFQDGPCCDGVGGQVSIFAKKDISIGSYNQLVAGSGIDMLSLHGNISTGKGTTMLACCDDIKLTAEKGSIYIGAHNDLTAIDGNICLTSASWGSDNITTGYGTKMTAFKGDKHEGNIFLTAHAGKIKIGDNNEYNAVGGNIYLTARGDVEVANNNAFNAFHQTGTGGSVSFVSLYDDITFGNGNKTNAVGGDILVKATHGYISTGNNNDFLAFRTGITHGPGGELTFLAGDNINIGNSNNLYGGDGICITSTGGDITTGSCTTFLTCTDDIDITAECGNICLGPENTVNAKGGDIRISANRNIITGSGDIFNAFRLNGDGGSITFRTASGVIAVGNHNQMNAVGGNVLLDADEMLSTGYGTVINAFRNGNTGGSVTLLSDDDDIRVGNGNTFNAVGGNVKLEALHGSIAAGLNDTFNAFSNGNPAGGNITLTAGGNVTLSPGDELSAVGGNITVTSLKGEIRACDVDFCTFNPVNSHKGDIILVSCGDLVLTDSELGAVNDIRLESQGDDVILTANTMVAGNETSGGSISITSGDDTILTYNNTLFAHQDITIQAHDAVVFGSDCTGNNNLCTDKGDICVTGKSITLGVGDRLTADDGSVSLLASRDIQLGMYDVLAAGGGNVNLTATSGNIHLGSHNVLNAFFDLSHPSQGGDINLSANHGTLNYGSHNNLNAVGGDVNAHAKHTYKGYDNLICEFPVYEHHDRNSKGHHNDDCCARPERPVCDVPIIHCTLPEMPEPPCVPACPTPMVCIPTKPVCPEPDVCPPPMPNCPTPQVCPPTPMECRTPPTPPDCPTPPVPPPPPPGTPGSPDRIVGAPPLPGALVLPQFSIIGNQCLTFFIQDAPSSYLQMTQGTKVAVAGPQAIQMADGEGVMRAGEEPITIQSGDTKVVLQPDAIAVVKTGNGQPMTVTALSAASDDGVAVTVDNLNYHVQPGEQLLITQTPSTGSAGSPGGTMTLKSGIEQTGSVYVLKATVGLAEYLPKIALLAACRECQMRNYLHNRLTEPPAEGVADSGNTAMAPQNNRENLTLQPSSDKATMLKGGLSHSSKSAPGPIAPYRTVSYATQALPSGIGLSALATLEPLGQDHFQLRDGNALIRTTRTTRIDTRVMSVLAKPGAILLLTDNRVLSRVRDLCDQHANDVQVIFGKHSFNLSPGKEIAVSRSQGDIVPRVYADGLARRNLHVETVDNFNIVTNDFSLLNMLTTHPLIRQLRKSKNVIDTKTLDEILKVAAVLNMVTDRYKGPYYGPTVKPGTGIAEAPLDPIF